MNGRHAKRARHSRLATTPSNSVDVQIAPREALFTSGAELASLVEHLTSMSGPDQPKHVVYALFNPHTHHWYIGESGSPGTRKETHLRNIWVRACLDFLPAQLETTGRSQKYEIMAKTSPFPWVIIPFVTVDSPSAVSLQDHLIKLWKPTLNSVHGPLKRRREPTTRSRRPVMALRHRIRAAS